MFFVMSGRYRQFQFFCKCREHKQKGKRIPDKDKRVVACKDKSKSDEYGEGNLIGKILQPDSGDYSPEPSEEEEEKAE